MLGIKAGEDITPAVKSSNSLEFSRGNHSPEIAGGIKLREDSMNRKKRTHEEEQGVCRQAGGLLEHKL